MSNLAWIRGKIAEEYEFLDFDQPKGMKECAESAKEAPALKLALLEQAAD